MAGPLIFWHFQQVRSEKEAVKSELNEKSPGDEANIAQVLKDTYFEAPATWNNLKDFSFRLFSSSSPAGILWTVWPLGR